MDQETDRLKQLRNRENQPWERNEKGVAERGQNRREEILGLRMQRGGFL